ncbi:alveolar macrophage chemotactic factor-like [Callorhinchus milii]|uniref:C-X-C motif chemokine 9-like n=1 Tax=Callorhinchus milii TaxID=7868 RepID=A0A4W3HDP4_CALMI|nr:alveolar macrophage chemotactic factor-like [Callorhinchus milii]|eukprot:gi/632966723/ref/XP_007899574.1/ PREDICTED: C-X-C motif chemokine 9-like [Callorhinchus milii]
MASKVAIIVLLGIALCLISTDAVVRLPRQRRCRCFNLANNLSPDMRIKNVKIFFKQGLCSKVEIVVNLNSGRRMCLNPDSKMGKKMINFMKTKPRSN